MKIPALKFKVIVFRGKVLIRSKIIINNTVMEKLNTFTHLVIKIL